MASGLVRVRLVTDAAFEGGEFDVSKVVAEVYIPPFNKYPDALSWGERVFVIEGEFEGLMTYREAFMYALPVVTS